MVYTNSFDCTRENYYGENSSKCEKTNAKYGIGLFALRKKIHFSLDMLEISGIELFVAIMTIGCNKQYLLVLPVC